MSRPPTPLERRITRLVKKPERAIETIVAHCDGTSGMFDRLAQRSDPARIGPADIVAVSILGAPIEGAGSAWLLGDEGQWLTTEILADIPSSAELWSSDAASILRMGDLFRLVRQRDEPALTRSAATRLLAAKRPALVPIDDWAARSSLRYRKSDEWWRGWRSALTPELLARIDAIRSASAEVRPQAAQLSALRILDVLLRSS